VEECLGKALFARGLFGGVEIPNFKRERKNLEWE
jgi:hypothetical protein